MRLIVATFILIGVLVTAWSFSAGETTAAPDWQTYSPPAWILGPIQGADGDEATMLENLEAIEQWHIPITAFHFDAPDWQACTGNGEIRYSDVVLERMREQKIRGLFWTVPLIGLECPEYQIALANDYFVKDEEGNVIVTDNFVGHGSWIDYDKPIAVEYYHSLLDRTRARAGDIIAGFYTDSVRSDNVGGEIEYGERYALDLLNYTREHIPDGEVVFKRYGKNTPSDEWLSANAHVAYVNDLPTNFHWMKEGVRRVFATSQFMSLPYNEFSGFHAKPPDAETYIRRMHWGAFQPVMENVPKGAQPWDVLYPPDVMDAYRYYANLHRELAPYLHSYDQEAFHNKTPIFRDMDKKRLSAKLGNEFFVKYVASYDHNARFKLPPGEWINYWDETQVLAGDAIYTINAPPGREPIFILRGAIIPMDVRNDITGHGTVDSNGSLTVNVYPKGHSSFRYYDPLNGWVVLDVTTRKQKLALCTLEAVPSQPLLYRIAGVRNKPNFVRARGGSIQVNGRMGVLLTEYATEGEAARSGQGWYYDAAAKRLIVKFSTPGTRCPEL